MTGVQTCALPICIHKALFRQLGEPRYIQLLVNPDEGVVAIQTVDKEMSGGQTHRIVEKRMHSENSYEIYSRPFIRKLREVEPRIEATKTKERCSDDFRTPFVLL